MAVGETPATKARKKRIQRLQAFWKKNDDMGDMEKIAQFSISTGVSRRTVRKYLKLLRQTGRIE